MRDLFMDILRPNETEKLSLGNWIEILSGLEVEYNGIRERLQVHIDEKDKMTYGINNGVIAFVDGMGRMYVGPETSDRIQALERAGYKRSNSLLPPLSSDGKPVDLILRERWRKMKEQAEQQNREETTAKHIELYRKAAKERGIKEVSGKWLTVDGVEFEMEGIVNGKVEKWKLPQNTDGFEMAADGRLEKVGFYNVNNGVVAFVDGEGRLRVGPETSDRIQALERAGYKRSDSLYPPLSGGEDLVDSKLREQWEKMKEEAEQQNREETTAKHIELYRKAAKERGIKEVSGKWLTVDGVEVGIDGFDEKWRIPQNTDGFQMADDGRLEYVGFYGTNNGVIAFVDGEGRLRVGPETSNRIQALERAGYKHSDSLLPPLSSGDKLVDLKLHEQWEKMKEEA